MKKVWITRKAYVEEPSFTPPDVRHNKREEEERRWRRHRGVLEIPQDAVDCAADRGEVAKALGALEVFPARVEHHAMDNTYRIHFYSPHADYVPEGHTLPTYHLFRQEEDIGPEDGSRRIGPLVVDVYYSLRRQGGSS